MKGNRTSAKFSHGAMVNDAKKLDPLTRRESYKGIIRLGSRMRAVQLSNEEL